MLVNTVEADKIILEVNELTKDILNKLKRDELNDDIDEVIEKRFGLINKLFEYANNNSLLQDFLNKLLLQDYELIQFICEEKEKISHVILNIKSLNNYVDVSLS